MWEFLVAENEFLEKAFGGIQKCHSILFCQLQLFFLLICHLGDLFIECQAILSGHPVLSSVTVGSPHSGLACCLSPWLKPGFMLIILLSLLGKAPQVSEPASFRRPTLFLRRVSSYSSWAERESLLVNAWENRERMYFLVEMKQNL